MEKQQSKLTPLEREWLREVDQYILDNLDNHQLVIGDIADAVCMSERQFFRRIEELTGQTPNHYVQAWRMRRAQEMLRAGQCGTVKEVALSVGFYNPDYFSRLYESFYGCRPVDFFIAD